MKRLPWGFAVVSAAMFVVGLLIFPLVTGDWPDDPAAPYVFGGLAYVVAYIQGAARGRKDAA